MLNSGSLLILLLELCTLHFAFAAQSSDSATSTTRSTATTAAGSSIQSATPTAHIQCGESSTHGTVLNFVKQLDNFCRRDLSIDQDVLWTADDVQYRMNFRASKQGYCVAEQCSHAFKQGLNQCRSDVNNIDKSGTAKFSCGEFQWLTSPAPPPPKTACQSPDHPIDKARFTRNQALEGLKHFKRSCSSTFMKEANTKVNTYAGCVLHYNPCAKSTSADKSVDIVFNITQTTWKEPNAYELRKAEIQNQFDTIVDGCDTDSTSRKWGGFSSHGDGHGDRLYTITGVSNRARQYPRSTKTIFVARIEHVADEEEVCKSWIST